MSVPLLTQANASEYRGDRHDAHDDMVRLLTTWERYGREIDVWQQYSTTLTQGRQQEAFCGRGAVSEKNALIVRYDLSSWDQVGDQTRSTTLARALVRCRHCFYARRLHTNEGQCCYGPTTFEEFPP